MRQFKIAVVILVVCSFFVAGVGVMNFLHIQHGIFHRLQLLSGLLELGAVAFFWISCLKLRKSGATR